MQSIYAYYGSRLHLILEDELADNYNKFLKAFYQAQTRHLMKHGREWDPDNEPLSMKCKPEWKKAYDDVGRVIKLLVEINGQGLELSEEETWSDYLEKVES